MRLYPLFFSLSLLSSVFLPSASASSCTYQTWDWDKIQKRSVNHQTIRKDRNSLTPQEKGVMPGCTVCEEDQEWIRIPGVPPFQVCRNLMEKVKRAVEKAKAQGFPIKSSIGYRVGKSKGALDSHGLRTEFSRHSYGVAFDFNSESNGLYDLCPKFGAHCRLIRGGAYHSESPEAITPASPLYQALVAEGFRWGGEFPGNQKDFMHFSLGDE